MISLFLANLIIMGLMQVYLTTKRQYLKTQTLLETHFDVQWVSDLVSDSVRRAGFTPCLGLDYLNVRDRRSSDSVVHAVSVANHSITIKRMSEWFSFAVIENPTTIALTQSPAFTKKTPILIADCEHAEVHTISNKTKSGIHLNQPLLFHYTPPIYVGEWIEERWYIKKNAQGVDALFYKAKDAEELSPLIHALQAKIQTISGIRQMDINLGLAQATKQLQVVIRGS